MPAWVWWVLATGSREQAAGGWAVSAGRVSAVEDRLTALGASAPDPSARGQALILRDAVRGARARLDALGPSGTDEALAIDLDDIAGELEAALIASRRGQPPGAPGSPGGPSTGTGGPGTGNGA